jgi:hypothetical protein
MDFVIGMPRSGTARLAYILSEAGGLASRHEYLLGCTTAAIMTVPTLYYAQQVGDDAAHALIRRYRTLPAIAVDACWKLTWVLPSVLAEYPDASIVHLVRDPRTNVIACHNLDYYGSAIVTPWRYYLPRIHRDDWERLTPFERVCAFWTESHRLALAAAADRPRRYLRVRFEDLGCVDSVEAVFDFLGAARVPRPRLQKVLATHVDTMFGMKDAMKAAKQRDTHDTLPPFDDCPASVRRSLYDICGAMATTLGYSIDAPDNATLGTTASTASTGAWASC